MKTRTVFAAMLLATVSISVGNAGSGAGEWERLKTGEIIISEITEFDADGSPRGEFSAKLYIKAKRKDVWDILKDYEKFNEYFPRVQTTRIVKEEGSKTWVFYHIKVLWVDEKHYMIFNRVDEYRRIEVSLDKSLPHDIRDTHSTWILEDSPDGAGTILTYNLFVDSGIPAPISVSKKLAKKSLPDVVTNVRKRAESGGKWRKSEGD